MDASLLARAAAMGRKDEEDASSALTNRWKTLSVLELMSPLALTPAGRPVLYGGEVEIYSEEAISLYDHSEKTKHLYGRCIVTTHRLFYMDDKCDPPVALYIPLEWVTRITKEAGFLARSAKLRIEIQLPPPANISSYFKLSFKDGGRDDLYSPLEASMRRRAWKETKPSHMADRRLQKRQFNTADAGIAGILRRQKEAQQESTELAALAFSDLANLMEKARDMVGLIERYVDSQKAQEGSKEENSDALTSLMLDMGIMSPVTRENAGGAYFNQLARQLAEFLSECMPKNGGIMTLSDIYCMFNRARGVELISPDDLYQAARLQQQLKLGYHLRRFQGGLIVLQADSHREDRVAERLLHMTQKSSSGFITSTDVSIEMHTSVPLALEYLKVAEELGKLCRDDTFEGINFYPNRFATFEIDT